MSIIANNLSYILSDGTTIFKNLKFSISPESKSALVGINGCGKSTLMGIISGNLTPSTGEILCDEKPYLVPQHFGQSNSQTVVEVLGISNKLNALKRILDGEASETDFDILSDDWNIEERLSASFNSWNLHGLNAETRMESLSGGEKTKVFLSGILLHNPHIILMDEPTNHLDEDSRKSLYQFIDTFKGTILAVSHDRAMLEHFTSIYELSEKCIRFFSMNFSEYCDISETERKALYGQAEHFRKELKKEKTSARKVVERQQKQNARGRSKSEGKCLARISQGNMKNKAQKSTAKLAGIHSDKIDGLAEKVAQANSRIMGVSQIAVDINSPETPCKKILIDAKELNFAYPGKTRLWQNNLTFSIVSGDRIRISGRNGSGKSTLLKLIVDSLVPSEGEIKRSHRLRYVYLDQEYSLVANDLTVAEQIQKFNCNTLPEHELNIRLNRFLFPKPTWDKRCCCLSGGEKMRLALCCLLAADSIPDIIIADEPTNNLDLPNIDRYGECDFVVCKDRKAVLAVQVSYDISSEKTRKREIAGLLLAARNTGCENLLLLTDHNDEDVTHDRYTIAIRPVFDYMLK